MSKKQTSVGWLTNELTNKQNGNGSNNSIDEIYNQALQMEREQIEEAFFKGHNDGYNAGVSCYDQVEFQSGDIYYTQTYE